MKTPTRAKVSTTDAEIDAAIARGKAHANDPHATAIAYDDTERLFQITMSTGGSFTVPLATLPHVPQDKSVRALADVAITPGGFGVWWKTLDTGYELEQLVGFVVGPVVNATKIGRKGGSKKSPAKTAAVRKNGARGGRPRTKVTP